MNFSGKLTSKIIIKEDFVRSDGTCALYLQVFLNKERKKFPVNLAVKPVDFDKQKQRVKSSCTFANDYNLIIEKMLSDINRIEIGYRLGNVALSMENLINDYENPTSKIDFITFWENEMKNQKEKLKDSTFRQQSSMLTKLKTYRKSLFFYEIDEDFLEKIKHHFKTKNKNQDTTIFSFIKTFKKILRIANKRGILTPLNYSDIHNGSFLGKRTFLDPAEVLRLYKYWQNDFINATHKAILSRFLFSCFTGLRISDIQTMAADNIFDNYIVFSAEKGNKLNRIPLNQSARLFIDPVKIFPGNFSEVHINRELKFIVKAVGIRKKISFHVSRHTFATNYLICGGRVEHLQKILGHSKITDTMIYVKIVESITDKQIHNMDEILNLN